MSGGAIQPLLLATSHSLHSGHHEPSLARQWRKAKRSIKTTKRIGEQAIAEGHATKIFTKRLRKRFQPVGARNFSKYVRRAADEFGSKKIVRQVVRLERMVDLAIRDMEMANLV